MGVQIIELWGMVEPKPGHRWTVKVGNKGLPDQVRDVAIYVESPVYGWGNFTVHPLEWADKTKRRDILRTLISRVIQAHAARGRQGSVEIIEESDG